MCRKMSATLDQIDLERNFFFPLIKQKYLWWTFVVFASAASLLLGLTMSLWFLGDLPIPIMYHPHHVPFGGLIKLWIKVQRGTLALLISTLTFQDQSDRSPRNLAQGQKTVRAVFWLQLPKEICPCFFLPLSCFSLEVWLCLHFLDLRSYSTFFH